jgi:HD superfamily phosphodiesterase
MKVNRNIESAELLFRQILEEYFISVFDEDTLFSHGLNHHRRVWNYAKELMLIAEGNPSLSDPSFPEKLLIASYLHDAGMSVDPGIRHGIHSRDLCLGFFRNNNLNEARFPGVLEAIENHDNKEYNRAANSDLLNILSVADDLDAYGYAGIYRYSEIYLKRGIAPSKIGVLIRENAMKRFGNFKSKYEASGEFFEKHKKRYELLDNFFSEYNKQISSYKFGSGKPNGYPGIIEVFLKVIDNGRELKKLLENPETFSYDQIMSNYFRGLNDELF